MDTNRDIDHILSRHSPEVRDLALRLRALMREAAPEGEERVHRDWGNIGYYHNGQFCYIAPQRSWVNLGFYQGVDLPDPHGLLEGTGKRLRHVKVRNAEEIPTAALKQLVVEALALNAG